jgi:fused signal recognition particle receptor
MLNTEDRRAQLESLLDRVKRNKGCLVEEREAASAEPLIEKEPTLVSLPTPAEPVPVVLESVPPPAVEEVETKKPIKLVAPAAAAANVAKLEEPVEPEPEAPRMTVVPELEPEPVIEPEPAPEPEPEPEPVPEPAVMAKQPVEETRSFEAAPPIAAEVAVVREDKSQREWTLDAVLKRAFNLGSR